MAFIKLKIERASGRSAQCRCDHYRAMGYLSSIKAQVFAFSTYHRFLNWVPPPV
ncbi:hypothetical protein PCI56_03340 [Plesiomonas shigelloides subsp. oncorhynchi]|nr:hypothetical protein [Plesiomonas shigelloides]